MTNARSPVYAVGMPPVLVGTYTRRIQASVPRIWENVLDWEHLPWLHRDTFASVQLEHCDATGWRAESSLHDGRPFTLEVTIDRATGCYHSRTIAGVGTGSDIVTRLTATTTNATDIAVEFWVPDIPTAQVAPVGAFYAELYRRLWDEDEAMMQRRQVILDTPHPSVTPVTLGLGSSQHVRAALPLRVDTPAGPVRIVDDAGTLRAHPTTCPHMGGPLDTAPIEDGCLTCPWHGYRFDLRRNAPRFAPGLHVSTDQEGHVTLSIE